MERQSFLLTPLHELPINSNIFLYNFIFIIVLIVFLLVYICFRFSFLNLKHSVDLAVEKSTFSPTHFLIYDRSNEKVCNRLIIVKPFDWILWAYHDELFVLNPEGENNCDLGCTPAVKIYKKSFEESCLKLNYNVIINAYKRIKAHVINFEIQSEKFTVFSAINILLKNYIKILDHDQDLNHILHSLENNEPVENTFLQKYLKTNNKLLKPHEVIALLTYHKPNHHELLKQYRKHISRRKN